MDRKPEGHQTISLRGKVNSSFDTFTGTVPECFNAEFNLEKCNIYITTGRLINKSKKVNF